MKPFGLYIFTKNWQTFWEQAGTAYPNSLASTIGGAIWKLNPSLFDQMEFWAGATNITEARQLNIWTDPTLVFFKIQDNRQIAVAKLVGSQINERNVRKMMEQVIAIEVDETGNLFNPDFSLIGIDLGEDKPGGGLISINPFTEETRLDFNRNILQTLLAPKNLPLTLLGLWLLGNLLSNAFSKNKNSR